MNSIQQIAIKAAAGQPALCTKDEALANKIAADMNAIADEGETYEVRPYQANRFVVAQLFDGKFEMYL